MQTLLSRYWGANWTLRPHQPPVIQALSAGRDALVLLPTGEGKSLCFQAAALMRGGLTIVISPLLALMQDQVTQLQQRGIPAVALNSQVAKYQRQQIVRGLRHGRTQLLYLSPEQLLSPELTRQLQQYPPHLIVVDEAHCISLWGHGFRPAYRQLRDWIAALPQRPPVGAFTATASPALAQDIVAQLGLAEPLVIQGEPLGNHLWLQVEHCWTPQGRWRRFKHLSTQGKTLVYARSRTEIDRLTQTLRAESPHWVGAYHAGLSPSQRQSAFHAFQTQSRAILVASTAFGMGVDISDIDRVIHWECPESLEAYVQEVGRAGRDRRPNASGHLLQLWGQKPRAGTFEQAKLQQLLPQVWQQLQKHPSTLRIQDHFQLSGEELNLLIGHLQSEGLIGFEQPHMARCLGPWSPSVAQHFCQMLQTVTRQRQVQAQAMRQYLRTRSCRRQALNRYFKGEAGEPCGHCDRCLSSHKR
jgi:RecQ family ATP-dependent DNA helicase